MRLTRAVLKTKESYSFREMLGLEFNARHNKNSAGAVWCEILKKKILFLKLVI